jgi:aerobic-type carbon monoxide dehydrogenase small subunit (CoxS/CutS family)
VEARQLRTVRPLATPLLWVIRERLGMTGTKFGSDIDTVTAFLDAGDHGELNREGRRRSAAVICSGHTMYRQACGWVVRDRTALNVSALRCA